jgi:hypothetical protein
MAIARPITCVPYPDRDAVKVLRIHTGKPAADLSWHAVIMISSASHEAGSPVGEPVPPLRQRYQANPAAADKLVSERRAVISRTSLSDADRNRSQLRVMRMLSTRRAQQLNSLRPGLRSRDFYLQGRFVSCHLLKMSLLPVIVCLSIIR